ncbi:hypothetical protein BGZ99_009159 [Dissophora globulifera]|uniref:Major facilitator superfamily (MFS) profile domain-containing protein n=1 Tax=Dissophora globulifera TaxID=979702 RepID=A0A9P6R7Q2_9FUNG|nr:hypothetical protein BGZ99_009159 [Dissophora globulifera]
MPFSIIIRDTTNECVDLIDIDKATIQQSHYLEGLDMHEATGGGAALTSIPALAPLSSAPQTPQDASPLNMVVHSQSLAFPAYSSAQSILDPSFPIATLVPPSEAFDQTSFLNNAGQSPPLQRFLPTDNTLQPNTHAFTQPATALSIDTLCLTNDWSTLEHTHSPATTLCDLGKLAAPPSKIDHGSLPSSASDISSRSLGGDTNTSDAKEYKDLLSRSPSASLVSGLSTALAPVDQGWRAWCVVLASVLIQTFAFAPTEFIFGVFEQEYLRLFPTATPSSIALIGTIGTSVTFLAGIISGNLSNRYGFRATSLLGTSIMTAALVLASFSTKIWHLYLTQGVLFGVGASLVYFVAIAAPTQWFKKKRGLAVGIGASGAGLGGFYLAPLAQYLVDSIGIYWTLRVLGLYSLVVCGLATALLFERIEPESQEQKEEQLVYQKAKSFSTPSHTTTSIFFDFRMPKYSKETAFVMLVLFQFCLSMAYLTPVYFLELYSTHIGISKQAGASINGWFNAACFVSRIGSGIIADYISSVWVLLICVWTIVFAVFVLWAALAKTFAVFLAFAVVYGIAFSGISTVTPVMIADYYGEGITLQKNLSHMRVGSVLGVVYTISGPALMSGSLISGHLLEMTKPHVNYLPVILYDGGVFAASAIFATAWIFSMERRKKKNLVANGSHT